MSGRPLKIRPNTARRRDGRGSGLAGGDTYGSLFGVTRNPYDLERAVGGSSGGPGAALAANLSTLALGEETSASIRRPGAWNAIVSMRPTAGLLSRSGIWDGDLNALLPKRASNPDVADVAMRRYLARNPSSPFTSREDIARSPDMAKSIPPSKVKVWEGPRR